MGMLFLPPKIECHENSFVYGIQWVVSSFRYEVHNVTLLNGIVENMFACKKKIGSGASFIHLSSYQNRYIGIIQSNKPWNAAISCETCASCQPSEIMSPDYAPVTYTKYIVCGGLPRTLWYSRNSGECYGRREDAPGLLVVTSRNLIS